MFNSCKKSLAVICGLSLGLVSVCPASANANNDFVEPGVATTVDSEKRVSLGAKICYIVNKTYVALCTLGTIAAILRILYICVPALLFKASVIFGKIVNFLDFLKFKLFSPFNFVSNNKDLVFNLRTKDGKKVNSLDDIASKGKDGEGKKDNDFVEYNLEDLSIEGKDIDIAENEYTNEDISPYGWEKGKYTEKEEKDKIQGIHDWVDGRDIFKENKDINDDFEENFKYFRRGYKPEEGCCYICKDSKEERDCYQSGYIADSEQVCI